MDLLFATTGSAGDVYPMIALGRALRQRGHHVRLLAPEEFGPLIEGQGLRFAALEPDSVPPPPRLLRRWLSVPSALGVFREASRLFGQRWRKLARASTIVPLLKPTCELIARHADPRRTVLVATSPVLGARIARDQLGLPLATIHLAPALLRSVHCSPMQPPFHLPPWLPPTVKRASYRLLDSLVLDPLLRQPINDLRAELRLAPVRRVLHDWRHSPDLVLGLFPEWFAPPQPDWPANVHLTDFLPYDGSDEPGLPGDVEHFLRAGSPPVVILAGSAIRHAAAFFRESIEACLRLRRRALVLTRYREQLPRSLPTEILPVEYLPLSQLLPRCAALIHCGGVGTLARALAASVPQLVMPIKNDQPDNARRLDDLRVARVVTPMRYAASNVAAALDALLSSPDVRTACRSFAARIEPDRDLAGSCALIEQLAARRVPRADESTPPRSLPRAA